MKKAIKRLSAFIVVAMLVLSFSTALAANTGGLRGTFHWVPLLKDTVSAYVNVTGNPDTSDYYARATVTVYNSNNASKSTSETTRSALIIIEGRDFCSNSQMSGVVRATGSIAATAGYSNQSQYPMYYFYPTVTNPYVS